MKDQKFIAVSGTMGVGKSTFVRMLAREFGFFPLFENFTANPFLAKFYQDMKRWAFQSQMFFLIEKVSQMRRMEKQKGEKPIIQDTPIYQDVYSYAQAQLVLGNMSRQEWGLYLRVFLLFEKSLPTPDLIIHLTAPVEAIYQRISKRGRRFETVGQKRRLLKYLAVLDRLNDRWVRRMEREIKIIKVDTDGKNYFNDRQEKEHLLMHLKSALKGIIQRDN